MATINPDELDLDAGEEAVQPSEGWHTADLISFAVQDNKAGTGKNMIFSFVLDQDDPDRPGYPFTWYVSLPSLDLKKNYEAWVKAGKPRNWDPQYMWKDGRHAYQGIANRIKKISGAFGGAESGKMDPGQFNDFLGMKVKIQLAPDKESGRMNITFDGVMPA